MHDERVWRNRLLAFAAVRLGGLCVFFLGLVIAYSDVIFEGGWPQLGAIVCILGVIDALFAPRLLKKLWDQQDRSAGDRPGDGRSGR